MAKKTTTSSFGVGRREGHDSSRFYARQLFVRQGAIIQEAGGQADLSSNRVIQGDWVDRIFCQSSENMPIPDNVIGLAFTSPPYNVGKDYDDDMDLEEYLALIERVGREVYRVLVPGGRYVVNIANLGRKPYIPLHRHCARGHPSSDGWGMALAFFLSCGIIRLL